MIGWKYVGQSYDGSEVFEREVDTTTMDTETYPGLISVNEYVAVLYNSDEFATALGIPTGIYTNGIYFWLNTEFGYISNFISPTRIVKIEGKYVDLSSGVYAKDIIGLHLIARTGSYHDLIYKPTIYTDVVRYCYGQGLSARDKQYARDNIDVYSMSQVDTEIENAVAHIDLGLYAKTADVETMIAAAISGAIGGSY